MTDPRDCPHGVQYRKRMHLCPHCMEPEIERLRERERTLIDTAHEADGLLQEGRVEEALAALERVRLWWYPIEKAGA